MFAFSLGGIIVLAFNSFKLSAKKIREHRKVKQLSENVLETEIIENNIENK